MTKRNVFTLILSVVIVLTPLGPPVRARHSSQTTEAKVKAEVTERLSKKETHVKVKLRNGSELKGHIVQTTDNGFKLTDDKTGNATDIAYADVVDVEGRGISKKKKILVATGIAVGVFIALVAYALTHYWD